MSDPVSPVRLHTVTSVRTKWAKQPDGSFTSGNVVVKRVGERSWQIYVDGVLTWPPSRTYAYHSAGTAKMGAASLGKPPKG